MSALDICFLLHNPESIAVSADSQVWQYWRLTLRNWASTTLPYLRSTARRRVQVSAKLWNGFKVRMRAVRFLKWRSYSGGEVEAWWICNRHIKVLCLVRSALESMGPKSESGRQTNTEGRQSFPRSFLLSYETNLKHWSSSYFMVRVVNPYCISGVESSFLCTNQYIAYVYKCGKVGC